MTWRAEALPLRRRQGAPWADGSVRAEGALSPLVLSLDPGRRSHPGSPIARSPG